MSRDHFWPTGRQAACAVAVMFQLGLLSGCDHVNDNPSDDGGNPPPVSVDAVQADVTAVDEGGTVTFAVQGTPNSNSQ